MAKGLLAKCLLITGVFIMACPDKSQQQSTEETKDSAEQPKSKLAGSISRLDKLTSEPGINFTDGEMAQFKIWPKGIIPYYIDDLSFDIVLRERIRNFLDRTNDVTHLRFSEILRPPTEESVRYVFFINRRGVLSCPDFTTRNLTTEGVQRVVLGYDCLSKDGEMGSLVLALAGVPPQHNAPDRDTYITINMDNIMPDKKYLFEIIPNSSWLFHGLNKYDYDSAGHYDFFKYTKNGKAVIIPKTDYFKDSEHHSAGQGDKLSYLDVKKIRMLYNYISKAQDYTEVEQCAQLFNQPSNVSNLINKLRYSSSLQQSSFGPPGKSKHWYRNNK